MQLLLQSKGAREGHPAAPGAAQAAEELQQPGSHRGQLSRARQGEGSVPQDTAAAPSLALELCCHQPWEVLPWKVGQVPSWESPEPEFCAHTLTPLLFLAEF